MPDRRRSDHAGPALGLVVTFCLLGGPLAGADAAREVGPAEFRRDLVGKTWTVELPNGDSATERVNADGTATISGAIEDSGHWRLSETGFCTTWTRMRDRNERCFTLDRGPGGMYRVYKPNGEVSLTILEVRDP